MAHQVNVFMENKPGRIHDILRILEQNAINLRALVIQDRGQYGLLKLLVNDPQKANLSLNAAGFASAMKDVLAVVIEDRPGGLAKLTDLFLREKVNISDSCGFVLEPGKTAVFCVEPENAPLAASVAKQQGFRILEDVELYEL